MEPTPKSLFEEHLAKHGEATTDDTRVAEAAAFQLLLELHSEHAQELKRLRTRDETLGDAVASGAAGSERGAERERFPVGTVIQDRYRIISLLGRGGMGEVFRADDLVLGQQVALKFLSEKLVWSEEFRKRFLDEVRLAREVSHPSICRVFDVGEVDGQTFLTMEYVDGEDLSSLLVRVGRLPEEKAIEISRQLCAGLAAVHERGIIHRDLKPGNVMIDGRGAVKIADFGLAGVFEEGEGRPTELAGTPAYMAPELTEGKGPSTASDVYALGLVLYEMFTGHPAFAAKAPAEVLRAHREDAPQSPSSFVADLDPAVEEVLLRCLEKDPALRPLSALAVSAALPGGDPLAEALARGETPSPQAVVSAGGSGALRSGIAYGLFGLTALLFWALCWAIPRTRLSGAIPLHLHPQVLEQRAKELLDGPLDYTRHFEGWDWQEAHVASGFEWASTYEDWMEAIESSGGELQLPAGDLPAPYYFWMRTSMWPIYSTDPLRRVSSTNPPPGHRWEAIVWLRPDGELDSYLAYRGEWSKRRDEALDDWDPLAPAEASTPDMQNVDRILRASGLDPEALHAVLPRAWPRVPVDLRLAWEGPAPGEELGGQLLPEVSVEASFFEGIPASVAVYDPDPPSVQGKDEPFGLDRLTALTREITTPLLVMGMMLAGAFLMLRNFRQRRGDRASAGRLAWFIVLVTFLRWVLEARYSYGISVDRFAKALGFSLFFGGACWVLYLGLEPHIRRTWPRALIGWTRALSGRWSDPMVGRDVLIGLAAGLAITLIEPVCALISEALGAPIPVPFRDNIRPLDGFAAATGGALASAVFATVLTLVTFLLMALLESLFRRKWAAIALCVLIGGIGIPQAGTFGEPLVDLLMGFLKIGVWITIAVRFGVLTTAMMQTVHMITMTTPLTTQLSAWYGAPTLLVLCLVVLPALLAARNASRGPARDH